MGSPGRSKSKKDPLKSTPPQNSPIWSSIQSNLESPNLLLIFSVSILFYGANLGGDFVFDDAETIVNNADAKFGGTPIWDVFKNDFWGASISSNRSHKSYRPLTVLSFRLNDYMSSSSEGLSINTWPYHVFNVLLHAINSILAVRLFERWLNLLVTVVGSEGSEGVVRNVDGIARLGGLIFALHPVHVEAVANITGRAELLSALGFMLSFLLYTKKSESKLNECTQIWISMALAGLGTLCKEQAITVLLLNSFYDVILMVHRFWHLHWQRISTKLKNSRADMANNNCTDCCSFYNEARCVFNSFYPSILKIGVNVGFLVILLLWRLWLMDFSMPNFVAADNPQAAHESIVIRVINYQYLHLLNLVLLIFPSELCFDYSMGCIPIIESILDYRLYKVIGYFVGLVAGIYWCIKGRDFERKCVLMLCAALYCIPFLPACHLFIKVGFVLAERVLYLPSLGFCLLLAYVLTCGLENVKLAPGRLRLNGMKFDKWLPGKAQAILFVMMAFGAKTSLRSLDWKSEYSLYKSGLNVCFQNAKIHYNLAKILSDNGNESAAAVGYRIALDLNPKYEQALNNLANIYEAKGRHGDAEQMLRRAVQLRPDFSTAWMNLGISLASQGKYKQSLHAYQTALKVRPNYADCLFNLGNLHLAFGQKVDAMAMWRNATRLKGSLERAWINMAILSDEWGDITGSIEAAQSGLRHVPRSSPLHAALAAALGKAGQFELAQRHFYKAIELQPTAAGNYGNLGVLYHRWGKLDKAKQMYAKALSIYSIHGQQIDESLDLIRSNYKLLLANESGQQNIRGHL